MTSTDIYSIELIIGYLLELKEKKIYEIGALKYYGNKLLTENSIEKHDQKEVIFLDTKEKKKRNHKLISLGALFEITLTDNFSIAVLISYLENLHSLKEKDFIFYQEKWRKLFKKIGGGKMENEMWRAYYSSGRLKRRSTYKKR